LPCGPQKPPKNTAQLIEGTVKKIDSGSEVVSVTNDAFRQVSDNAAKVGSLVAEISEAGKEQSNGIEQVNIAISEMDKVIQQNAANAEESASASEEMNAQAEQLREYVQELVVWLQAARTLPNRLFREKPDNRNLQGAGRDFHARSTKGGFQTNTGPQSRRGATGTGDPV
jgi:ABC-type transporter Mla subunit MlaD